MIAGVTHQNEPLFKPVTHPLRIQCRNVGAPAGTDDHEGATVIDFIWERGSARPRIHMQENPITLTVPHNILNKRTIQQSPSPFQHKCTDFFLCKPVAWHSDSLPQWTIFNSIFLFVRQHTPNFLSSLANSIPANYSFGAAQPFPYNTRRSSNIFHWSFTAKKLRQQAVERLRRTDTQLFFVA